MIEGLAVLGAVACGLLGWSVYRSLASTWTERAVAVLEKTLTAASSLERLHGGEYLPRSMILRWIEESGWEKDGFEIGRVRRFLPRVDAARYDAAKEILGDPFWWAEQYNEDFVARRLQEIVPWAEHAIGHSLTLAQRLAIVRDEDVNLIVAGAGTGKTSTILGKVLYLLERGLASPDEILVLAFNRDVADEVGSRISALGHSGVSVSTFHAKGFQLLGEAEGAKPTVSRLATSDVDRKVFLEECLKEIILDDECMALLSTWWIDLMVQWVELDECKTRDERLRKEAGLGLVTLSGLRLKSQSEVKVANALSLYGVRWEYEARYSHTPSSAAHRDYTPDFFLPDHGIWLEVWGCWRDVRPGEHYGPPYREQMQWKRDLHLSNATVLLEVFQDDVWVGPLEEALRDLLTAHEVSVQPLTMEARLKLLESGSHEVRRFVLLVDAFLNLQRGGGWTIKALQEKAETLRDRVFLKLFALFHQSYEQRLSVEGKIDFHEMLLRANGHLSRGTVSTRFRYILVDEFQDTSHTRVELLNLMRERTQGSRLFLVGDDWQSIYRFAGSDLDLFVSAPDRLGPTIRTDLDQTFRLESDVLSVSSRFVMRNPGQLRKELRARAASGSVAGVSIRFYDGDELLQCFASALEDIAFRTEGAVSVLVLARYLHVFEDLDLKDPSLTHSGRIELLPSTVHRAKGLEADHVVVLDLRAGTHGFPSEIADDRVLRIVTHGEDDFQNAEERRLFYVALTRTRGRVYLLAGSDRPSGFVQELLADEYSDAIEVFGEKSERHRCPLCQGMTIRQKAGPEGTFWACLHYPRCEGNLTICDACGDGAIEPEVTENRVVRFRCSRCPATAEVCPACGTGALLARRGPFGSFWGCSNWRRDESGCVFTKKANIAGQSS